MTFLSGDRSCSSGRQVFLTMLLESHESEDGCQKHGDECSNCKPEGVTIMIIDEELSARNGGCGDGSGQVVGAIVGVNCPGKKQEECGEEREDGSHVIMSWSDFVEGRSTDEGDDFTNGCDNHECHNPFFVCKSGLKKLTPDQKKYHLRGADSGWILVHLRAEESCESGIHMWKE